MLKKSQTHEYIIYDFFIYKVQKQGKLIYWLEVRLSFAGGRYQEDRAPG